jgi:NAD(P)-dependent dehydrogenase (short-subunit alcohol dehydrogenase family)
LPGFKPKWAEREPVRDFYAPIDNEEWRYMIDGNLTSIFLCTRAVGPHMIHQKRGKIVNITSVAGARGFQYHTLYTTTKAAVNMFTRSLALEWARYNINVNAIGPGHVLTAFSKRIFEDEETKKQTLRSIPLGRFCEPREVGLLVLYLVSSASDFITGQTIYIDGGSLA